MTEQFNIPVVLLIFKRKDKLTQIMSRVSQVKPKKIYIIADGPRDDSEKEAVLECRTWLESLIDWDCEVIKNYADTNRAYTKTLVRELSGFSKEKKLQFSWKMTTCQRLIFLDFLKKC